MALGVQHNGQFAHDDDRLRGVGAVLVFEHRQHRSKSRLCLAVAIQRPERQAEVALHEYRVEVVGANSFRQRRVGVLEQRFGV